MSCYQYDVTVVCNTNVFIEYTGKNYGQLSSAPVDIDYDNCQQYISIAVYSDLQLLPSHLNIDTTVRK